jgi:hypothetical protein
MALVSLRLLQIEPVSPTAGQRNLYTARPRAVSPSNASMAWAAGKSLNSAFSSH